MTTCQCVSCLFLIKLTPLVSMFTAGRITQSAAERRCLGHVCVVFLFSCHTACPAGSGPSPGRLASWLLHSPCGRRIGSASPKRKILLPEKDDADGYGDWTANL